MTAWHERVAEALRNYGLEGVPTRLLTLSENATHLVEIDPPKVLRVNRPSFRTRSQIESEISWVEALRRDGVLNTPRTIPDREGRLVTRLPGGGDASGCALLMDFVPGRSAEGGGSAVFGTLGDLAARMHDHADRYVQSTVVDRPSFLLPEIIGEACSYGHWSDLDGLTRADRSALAAVEERASARLADRDGARGLIHGDMRAANLLVDDDAIAVIDFDDCGWSWRFYELACALSFVEAEPSTPESVIRWLRAYTARRPEAIADVDLVADLVMLRRLMLIAWLASRSHTVEAARMTATYLPESIDLGERYLAGEYLTDLETQLEEIP